MAQILEPDNIRYIVDGEPNAAEVFNRPTHDLLEETDAKLVRAINELESDTADVLNTKSDKTTQVIAGTGLSGGGTLDADRTFSVNYGTAAGTAAQGNDSRIVNAVQNSRVTQGTGASTTDIMSQKAVTDQLATYAPSAHTHDLGQITGLDGAAFPKGTKMLFQQTTAPTGWVKNYAHDNKALRVVTGAARSGGSNTFSSAFNSAMTSSSAGAHSHDVTVNNHTLTVAQMPSHNHGFAGEHTHTQIGARYTPAGGPYDLSAGGRENSPAGTVPTGSAGEHIHSTAGSSGAHNHGASSSSAGDHTHTLNLNVQYVDLIIASKQ